VKFIFGGHTKNAKAGRQLFGQVWEYLGKIICTPKNLLAATRMEQMNYENSPQQI